MLERIASGLGIGEVIVVVLAAFVGGLARGFSGFGAALIFMPLASAVVAPRVAAPLLLVIDAVATLPLLPGAWRRADRGAVGVMVLGALAGVPFGTWLLAEVDPLTLRWAISAGVGVLLAMLASGWRYRGRPSVAVTAATGALAGLFAGAAQIGGPPVVAYWLGRATSAAAMRANIVLYFAASTVLTGIAYVASSLITVTIMLLALVAGPAYAAGIWLGARLFGRAAEATFRRACFGLIAAAAILGLPILDVLRR